MANLKSQPAILDKKGRPEHTRPASACAGESDDSINLEETTYEQI
ncbi:MAG: hypothetical protein QF473_20440 [Planctomycetota bacterium]|jgi:hypothetical protein|nr:hypothetical protein [Planctomycetota bacterium]